MSDETSLADARSAKAHLRADEILAALAAYVDATSAAAFEVGAAESAKERRRVERLGRLRAHENPHVQAAATMVDSGELTLAEAESVAAGGWRSMACLSRRAGAGLPSVLSLRGSGAGSRGRAFGRARSLSGGRRARHCAQRLPSGTAALSGRVRRCQRPVLRQAQSP